MPSRAATGRAREKGRKADHFLLTPLALLSGYPTALRRLHLGHIDCHAAALLIDDEVKPVTNLADDGAVA